MPDGPTIILTLKVLVSAVTVLLVASLVALVFGRKRLHGLINKVFFALTITTVVAFELILRFGVDVASAFSPEARVALQTHLYFAIPSALLLPFMLVSGVRHWKVLHIAVGGLFLLFWTGTFITGIFYLPHR